MGTGLVDLYQYMHDMFAQLTRSIMFPSYACSHTSIITSTCVVCIVQGDVLQSMYAIWHSQQCLVKVQNYSHSTNCFVPNTVGAICCYFLNIIACTDKCFSDILCKFSTLMRQKRHCQNKTLDKDVILVHLRFILNTIK